jgi:hypothetical protein
VGVFLPFDAAVVATSVLLVAGAVPNLNVELHCHFVASKAEPVDAFEACMQVEMRTRDQLLAQWAQFSSAEKSYCLRRSTMGPEATYTELLTCLEVARDARLLREKDSRRPKEQTGNAGQHPR